jgi:glycosyltransferase involved in cell wall biosynthesis
VQQFLRVIHEFKPDIVSVHFPVWQTIPLLALQAIPRRWRLVVTVHGNDIRSWPFIQPRLPPLQRLLFKQADAVTAVSQSLLQNAVELYPFLRDKARVIHNGISPWWFDSGVKELAGSGPQYVLFVGRFHTVKGVDLLLRAWAIVRRRISGITLWLVGDGPELKNLIALTYELRVNEFVRFVGRKPRQDLRPLYRNAELVAIPSRNEGLPLVALEAGACGSICLGTRVGGLAEVIEDNVTGFLVEPESPEALADALLSALGQPQEMKQRMSVAAKQRIQRHFSQERIIGSYVHLFQSLSKRRFRRLRNAKTDHAAKPWPTVPEIAQSPGARAIDPVPDHSELSIAAEAEDAQDSLGLPAEDPSASKAIEKGIAWLGHAQDNSASRDGAVASHYSLIKGWSASYPETTGYIVPTMLAYAKLHNDESVRQRAQRMLDWLMSIQFPEGGFQGGQIGITPVVPVTFNTGQILLGLVAGTKEFGDQYREAMLRAADWLVKTQDSDGCWRSYPTPFASPGEKAYETHVAWGLLEAARLVPNKPYAESALANIRWALGRQQSNGWFADCCVSDASHPLTHTLGYVLRGLVEAYRFTNDELLLQASRKTADGLLSAVKEEGFLPGRLNSHWEPSVSWACLTGSAQIALCWLMLYQDTTDTRYRDVGFATNRYLRRTMRPTGPVEIHGGIKGSFPVSGGYCPYEYPSWACKFFIDSNQLEQDIQEIRIA